jgi:hypothetical protein
MAELYMTADLYEAWSKLLFRDFLLIVSNNFAVLGGKDAWQLLP